jgi:hypothetical protein
MLEVCSVTCQESNFKASDEKMLKENLELRLKE